MNLIHNSKEENMKRCVISLANFLLYLIKTLLNLLLENEFKQKAY